MSARVECPLCGPSPARPWRRHAGCRIVRCRGCGLLVTWPPPSAADLASFYESGEYYDAHAMGDVSDEAWDARAGGILSRVPAPVASVLDYGAGEGHALAALRRLGLRAEGVEPSIAGRAAARARHALDLWPDLAAAARASFDLATLIHSLEHVGDPVAALGDVAARVRPGGFVFVEVPHARTVELLTRRGRERVLHLPAHLYHFTPETLARVVARAGLETVAVHLSNPEWLERLFAWRARRQGASAGGDGRGATDAAASAASDRRAGGARALWAARVLPALRRRFPGYKFQLVARRPADAA